MMTITTFDGTDYELNEDKINLNWEVEDIESLLTSGEYDLDQMRMMELSLGISKEFDTIDDEYYAVVEALTAGGFITEC